MEAVIIAQLLLFSDVKKEIIMKPSSIKVEKETLTIRWSNSESSDISLRYLREECPCAGCKGETILLHTYRPPKLPIANPDMCKIKNLKMVGEYAIQIWWKDGHDTGIYSWEYLKQLAADQANGGKQNYEPLL